MLKRMAFREAGWHTGTAAAFCFDREADCVERRRGVKTEFCPDVAGFCPLVSWILSWCGRGLSWCAVNKVGRTFRMGSNCSSGDRVKSSVDSGGNGALVLRVPVLADLPRARARGSSIRFGRGESRGVCSAVSAGGSVVMLSGQGGRGCGKRS